MSRHMTIVVCATMISAVTVSLSLLWLEIPRHWEPSLLAGVPAFVSPLVAIAPLAWRRWRTRRSVASASLPGPIPALLAVRRIWGPSLDSLDETISLAEQRIEDAQERLASDTPDRKTSLNQIFWIGYKAIQTARAIHVLCENGYASQAYSKCRELMELEANTFFIMTSGEPEETCKRYSVWSNAKFYDYVRKNRQHLDISDKEWTDLDAEYQKNKTEYARNGEDIHSRDGWAVAWRDGKTRKIKAQNVVERAKASMPYLAKEPNLLHEVWRDHWDRVNEAIHNSPRALWMDQASPAENTAVTGSSNYGLKEPIQDTARMILNISSVISQNIPAEDTKTSEILGCETMAASTKTVNLLIDVPVAVSSWWQRREEEQSQI